MVRGSVRYVLYSAKKIRGSKFSWIRGFEKRIHENKGLYMVHINICKTTKNLTHEKFALYGICVLVRVV